MEPEILESLKAKENNRFWEAPTCNWHSLVVSPSICNEAEILLKSLHNEDMIQPWAVPAPFKATAQSQF